MIKFETLLLISCITLTLSHDSFTGKGIEGNWQMCKEFSHGVMASRNYCPTIVFYKNGTGTCEDEKPLPRFNWKIDRDSIFFSFETDYDKRVLYHHIHAFDLKNMKRALQNI